MKKTKLSGFLGLFFATIVVLAIVGCEKEAHLLPQEEPLAFGLEQSAIAADELTPEGYKMIPIVLSLEVKAESYFDGDYPEGGGPFTVTISGKGYWEEIGHVTYFERIDTRPEFGVVKGEGRIERQVDVVQRCIPDKPTIYFQTFPQEKWQPLPIGNYQINASVSIKGGLVEFDGAYGEATRSITFIEGLLTKGVGLMYGHVFVPDALPQ